MYCNRCNNTQSKCKCIPINNVTLPVVEEKCPEKANIFISTDSVFYNIDCNTSNLLDALNLPEGVSLTQILEAINKKFSSFYGYNVNNFTLGQIANEYNTVDFQSLIESIIDKLYKIEETYNIFYNDFQKYINIINKINNFISNPTINTIFDIGLTGDESLQQVIERIINYIGVLKETINTGNGQSQIEDTNTVILRYNANKLSARAVLSKVDGNVLQAKQDGLYAVYTNPVVTFDPLTNKLVIGDKIITLPFNNSSNTPISVINPQLITLNVSGQDNHTLKATLDVGQLIDLIAATPIYKSKFCNICGVPVEQCTQANNVAIWLDTGNTRCTNDGVFDLQKEQVQTNKCFTGSGLFAGYEEGRSTKRWVTVEVNSAACGYSGNLYCYVTDCIADECTAPFLFKSLSTSICLKDRITNLYIATAYDLTVDYRTIINGVSTTYTITIYAGNTSIKTICHLAPISSVASIVIDRVYSSALGEVLACNVPILTANAVNYNFSGILGEVFQEDLKVNNSSCVKTGTIQETTYTVSGSTVGGTVIIDSNGTFSFTPTDATIVQGKFSYQLFCNGESYSTPKIVTIDFAARRCFTYGVQNNSNLAVVIDIINCSDVAQSITVPANTIDMQICAKKIVNKRTLITTENNVCVPTTNFALSNCEVLYNNINGLYKYNPATNQHQYISAFPVFVSAITYLNNKIYLYKGGLSSYDPVTGIVTDENIPLTVTQVAGMTSDNNNILYLASTYIYTINLTTRNVVTVKQLPNAGACLGDLYMNVPTNELYILVQDNRQGNGYLQVYSTINYNLLNEIPLIYSNSYGLYQYNNKLFIVNNGGKVSSFNKQTNAITDEPTINFIDVLDSTQGSSCGYLS